MIPYSRDPQQVIPPSSVKIVGLGGAGINMLERIAKDGMDGAELLAVNTDVRTLGSSQAKEKIQLGINLTKGLGAGGDPELGHQAVLEAEEQVRAALKGRRIVFLCVGLGGGTGSGAAPIVTRIAREEGAFVVVFATMPFAFEGKRRRDQAETSLNELAVLSNALVTFDNNRMGELVLAKQGIHQAFAAADRMISESIKAVIRLVIRPGLINVGLDDLMSALRTNRSRCLFGSGSAQGPDRAEKALRNALASPLLDQGALLKEAQTVLVHLCGGESLTLFEIELLMQRLQAFVPESAHVLFGAAVDPSMGDALSITLISALPEDSLAMAPRKSLSQAAVEGSVLLDPSQGFTAPRATAPAPAAKRPPAESEDPALDLVLPEASAPVATPPTASAKTARAADPDMPSLFDDEPPFAEAAPAAVTPPAEPLPADLDAGVPAAKTRVSEEPPTAVDRWADEEPPAPADKAPVAVAEFVSVAKDSGEPDEDAGSSPSYGPEEETPKPIEEDEEIPDLEASGFSPIPRKRPGGVPAWTAGKGQKNVSIDVPTHAPTHAPAEPPAAEPPKLKLGIKPSSSDNELGLDSAPRGRFEGENPNVFEGEDLDLPPFLRKKK